MDPTRTEAESRRALPMNTATLALLLSYYGGRRVPLALACVSPTVRMLAECQRPGLFIPPLQYYHLPNGNNNTINTAVEVFSSRRYRGGQRVVRSTSAPHPAEPPAETDGPEPYGDAEVGDLPDSEVMPLWPEHACPSGCTRWVAMQCVPDHESLERAQWWLRRGARAMAAEESVHDAPPTAGDEETSPAEVAVGSTYQLPGEVRLGLSVRGVTTCLPQLDAEMLPNLRALTADKVQVGSVSFSPAFAHSVLTHLHLSRSPGIVDLNFLSGLPQLLSITLNWLPVSDIEDMVTYCPHLRAVGLHNCLSLHNIEPLSRLTELNELDLNSVPASGFPRWSGPGRLATVRIIRCETMVDLSALAGHGECLTSLLLSELPVRDVTWLGACTRLRILMLAGLDSVASLDALGSLRVLEDLHISSPHAGVAVDSVVALCAPHGSLRALSLVNFKGEQNWADIATLTDLDALTIRNSSTLRSVEFLAGLSDLVDLDLSLTNVRDISPLRSLRSLSTVYLSHLQVTSLLPLTMGASATKLTELRVDNCLRIPLDSPAAENCEAVGEWASLANLTQLRRLSASLTRMNTLQWVAHCPKLRFLDTRGCTYLADVSPLSGRSHIRVVTNR